MNGQRWTIPPESGRVTTHYTLRSGVQHQSENLADGHALKGGIVISKKRRFIPSPPFSSSSTALHSIVHHGDSPIKRLGINKVTV
jgi:hypothetical protein